MAYAFVSSMQLLIIVHVIASGGNEFAYVCPVSMPPVDEFAS